MNDDVINNDITILIVLYKESYELISKTLNPINSFKKNYN